MSKREKRIDLFENLKTIAREINRDRFMLMEFLGPVVDGCRAALNVSIDKAEALSKLTEDDIDSYMDRTEQSFHELTICFHTKDMDDVYSLVFDSGEAYAYDECVEADVVIEAEEPILCSLFDADSDISPVDGLGVQYQISGNDSGNIIEALGVLCYAPLLRVARSGVDPSSLLSENADSIILAAASDLVTKLIKRWIDSVMTGSKA
ncbi:MAG: hypothetical protein ACFFEF_14985 [Candidatus Thorarchaeota archaeon]